MPKKTRPTVEYSVFETTKDVHRFWRVEKAVDFCIEHTDWSDVTPDVVALTRAVAIDRLFDRPSHHIGTWSIVVHRRGSAR